MNTLNAVEITQKLRSIYNNQARVEELFLKIGEVSNFTPLILTGNKIVFSFLGIDNNFPKISLDTTIPPAINVIFFK